MCLLSDHNVIVLSFTMRPFSCCSYCCLFCCPKCKLLKKSTLEVEHGGLGSCFLNAPQQFAMVMRRVRVRVTVRVTVRVRVRIGGRLKNKIRALDPCSDSTVNAVIMP